MPNTPTAQATLTQAPTPSQQFTTHCKSILNQQNTQHDNIIKLLSTINWIPWDLEYLQQWCNDLFDEELSVEDILDKFNVMFRNNWIREYYEV